MNYVEQREAELKAKYQQEMQWVQFIKAWGDISVAEDARRNAEFWQERFNQVRSKYVRKGRKPGYSPKKAA